MVEIMVWVMMITTLGGVSVNQRAYNSKIYGLNNCSAITPKTTSPTQLPTSMVPINLLGLFVTIPKRRPVKLFLFLSNSTLNLLLDTNAISVPAKKAQRINERNKRKMITCSLIELEILYQGIKK